MNHNGPKQLSHDPFPAYLKFFSFLVFVSGTNSNGIFFKVMRSSDTKDMEIIRDWGVQRSVHQCKICGTYYNSSWSLVFCNIQREERFCNSHKHVLNEDINEKSFIWYVVVLSLCKGQTCFSYRYRSCQVTTT